MKFPLWTALTVALACFLPHSHAASPSKRQDLAALAKRATSHAIAFNPTTFERFTSGERDYSLSVVFNALGPAQNCVPCREFQKQYTSLANQWTRSRPDKKLSQPHFWAYVDFNEKNGVLFQKLGIQSAPLPYFFPPTVGPHASKSAKPETYDPRFGLTADAYARWIVSHLPGVSFKYSEPFDYSLYLSAGSLLGALSFVLYRNRSALGPLLALRYLWAAGALALILLMISGYMWNQIRHPPYMTANGMIAGGFQAQYGVETHIVSALYGLLGISVYVIAFALPNIKDPVAQRVGTYVWLSIFLILHAVLVTTFKSKNGAYPFGWLF